MVDLRAPGESDAVGPPTPPALDVYEAALPWSESWRALGPLLGWLLERAPEGGVVLDASFGPPWTALWLAARLPGRRVVALWRALPGTLAGELPEGLTAVLARPERPLPFAKRSFDAVIAHDALHARPELLRQALRVSRGPVVLPHVHARDPADPVPFERQGLRLSAAEWRGWARRVAASDRRRPLIFSELALSRRSEGAHPAPPLRGEESARNLLILLDEPACHPRTLAAAPTPRGSDLAVLPSPLYRIEADNAILRRDDPSIAWLLARHPARPERVVLDPAEAVLRYLARRPARVDELAALAGRPLEEVERALIALEGREILSLERLPLAAVRHQMRVAGAPPAPPRGEATLIAQWRRALARAPQRTFLHVVEDGSRFSYAEVDELARRLAGWLARAGAGPGATLLVQGHPRAEGVLALWGAWFAGVRPAIVDPGLPPAQLAEIARRVGATIYAGDEPLDGVSGWLPLTREGLAGALTGPPVEPRTPDEEDEALVLFTTGSTGNARGVVHTHRSVWMSVQILVDLATGSPEAVWATGIGMHAIAGLRVSSLAPVWGQAQVALLPPTRGVGGLLSACADAGVTVLSASPAVVRALDTPALAPLGSGLKVLISSGAPLDPATRRRVAHALDLRVVDAYGLTETGGAFMVADRPDDPAMRVVDCLVRALDPEGLPVSDGEIGELVVWSEANMARALDGPNRVIDGWFHTGDLGRRTPGGDWELVGRVDRQIALPSGEKVQPEAVERALSGLPGVTASVVLLCEGRLTALVEGEAEPSRLAAALALALPPHQIPRLWRIVARLPRAGVKLDLAAAARLALEAG